jgi:cytochrome c
MFTRKSSTFAVILVFAVISGVALAQVPNLGKPIDPADIGAWNISILPDGTGLPPGNGTPAQGASVYVQKCLMCHGVDGKGGPNNALVGNPPLTGGDRDPVKTIANYWPYATTIFDFIRRTMPWQQPRSLTNEEVYSLTAYILSLNKLIGENDAMNAQTLPKVRMPNRDGFVVRYPDKI